MLFLYVRGSMVAALHSVVQYSECDCPVELSWACLSLREEAA